jgi:hypothetical protein
MMVIPDRQKSKSLLLLMLLVLIPVSSYTQEKGRISPDIQLQYFKNSGNQSYLQATLTCSMNRMVVPIPGMEISFYTNSGRKELLATLITDEKGVAKLPLADVTKLPVNSEGLWPFVSEFTGNDTIDPATSDFSVKDVKLQMTLSEIDSTKTVSLDAKTMQNGREVPVSGEIVMIYVPRMFSLLPIAEATLDENGTASAEFPSDLPGDKAGNLTIIARIEENPTFGNVEQTVIRKWGIPTSYSVPETHRALWTKTPPTWMIVTLSVLLAGVWGHYLFAVISLVLIKIDSKGKKEKKEKVEI